MHEELKEEEIVNKVGGRFKLSTLIQKRLVQLNAGSRPLVEMETKDNMEIVLQEILQDKIFLDAGLEWRMAGCSMCLAMNPDQLAPGERCASTSNRNFEGRQGRGGRTHLMSPAMAAAAAVTGHLTDVRKFMELEDA